MYRGKSKILPIVLVTIVAVVAIIALVSLGRAILGGGQDKVVDDSVTRALLNTELDRSVRMTVRGPIVADEDFRSYELEVSPIGRRLTIYKGYLDEVVDSSRLTNNTEAYAELVNALNRAGFTQGATDSEDTTDFQGICATGRLYTFELMRAQSSEKRFWISSCRDAEGSFKGNGALVRRLLEEQIPNSRDLLREIDI